MLLKYLNAEGKLVEHELTAEPVTIGRSSEASIVIPSEKASRVHCAIRQWDEDFVIKDLKSRNGTYVNDQRVETAVLHVGDTIRIGAIVISVERRVGKGTTTILKEVDDDIAGGRRYSTLLREIVQSADNDTKPKKKAT